MVMGRGGRRLGKDQGYMYDMISWELEKRY